MKPTKNRIMCPECGRSKMLFETQKQADNFIKWNGDDIDTDGGTLRSYYCPSCGGYHISSKPFKPSYAHNTEALINRYKKDVEVYKSLVKEEPNAEKFDRLAEEMCVKFIKELPKTMEFTKEGLRDLFDGWQNVNKIEEKQVVMDLARHKIYERLIK